jgi:hypothetical protein
MHHKRIVDDSRLARMMLHRPCRLRCRRSHRSRVGNEAIRCVESSRRSHVLDLTMPTGRLSGPQDPAGYGPTPPTIGIVGRRSDVGGEPSAEARRSRSSGRASSRKVTAVLQRADSCDGSLAAVDKRRVAGARQHRGWGCWRGARQGAWGVRTAGRAGVDLLDRRRVATLLDDGRGPIKRSRRYASRSSVRSWARA